MKQERKPNHKILDILSKTRKQGSSQKLVEMVQK
jgi:hypothetical protein